MGVLVGKELWAEPEGFELAIDAAVEAYGDAHGLSSVMVANGGFDSGWGL